MLCVCIHILCVEIAGPTIGHAGKKLHYFYGGLRVYVLHLCFIKALVICIVFGVFFEDRVHKDNWNMRWDTIYHNVISVELNTETFYLLKKITWYDVSYFFTTMGIGVGSMQFYNKSSSNHDLEVGDLVLKWKNKAHEGKGEHTEFQSLWLGPFIITENIRPNTFRL